MQLIILINNFFKKRKKIRMNQAQYTFPRHLFSVHLLVKMARLSRHSFCWPYFNVKCEIWGHNSHNAFLKWTYSLMHCWHLKFDKRLIFIHSFRQIWLSLLSKPNWELSGMSFQKHPCKKKSRGAHDWARGLEAVTWWTSALSRSLMNIPLKLSLLTDSLEDCKWKECM